MLASLRKAMELLRIGVACSTALVVRRRALLTAAARELTPRAVAGVMRAFALGITRGVEEIAHLRASLMIPLRSSAAGMAKALEAVRLWRPRASPCPMRSA